MHFWIPVLKASVLFMSTTLLYIINYHRVLKNWFSNIYNHEYCPGNQCPPGDASPYFLCFFVLCFTAMDCGEHEQQNQCRLGYHEQHDVPCCIIVVIGTPILKNMNTKVTKPSHSYLLNCCHCKQYFFHFNQK